MYSSRANNRIRVRILLLLAMNLQTSLFELHDPLDLSGALLHCELQTNVTLQNHRTSTFKYSCFYAHVSSLPATTRRRREVLAETVRLTERTVVWGVIATAWCTYITRFCKPPVPDDAINVQERSQTCPRETHLDDFARAVQARVRQRSLRRRGSLDDGSR